MKKKITLFLMVIMLIASMIPAYAANGEEPKSEEAFKAMWVATVLNLDYPIKPTTNADTLRQEADEAIAYAKNTGLNAIILQVRPSGDAFYKSQYFPWSKYLTGTQGIAPDASFDPLEYWVKEAHKNGIELHAWINPYRITRKTAKETAHDYTSLSDNHPALKHKDWVVEHTDGNLYFDPGNPEVRSYILESIDEILENYAVDGIHFDDYFYPDVKFEDTRSYNRFNPKHLSLEDWRRENVNQLIFETNKLVNSKSKNIEFGVSPFAVWQNKSNDPMGSDTKALESYSAHYADTKKWVENNWLDYIAPQIYWEIGYKIADYETVLSWWNKVVKGTDVKLIIGQAPYRLTDKDKNSPWYGTEEIFRQMALNNSHNVQGSIFFRYQLMKSNKPFSSRLSSYYGDPQTEVSLNPEKLFIARPSKAKFETTAKSYYIGGASNPKFPLYINDEEVLDRTTHGYFGYFYKLTEGENKIVLKNGADVEVRTITKITPKPSGQGTGTVTKNEIIPAEHKNWLAVVNKPFTSVYNEPSLNNGGAAFLDVNIKDPVVAYNRDFYKLKSGYWILKKDVSLVNASSYKPKITSAKHFVFDTKEIIAVSTKDAPMIKLYGTGSNVVIDFPSVESLPVLFKNSQSLLEKIEKKGNGYVLSLSEADKLQGFDYNLKENGYEIILYKQFKSYNNTKPLEGATIMIDPGHGGKDTGTLGLLGERYAEKELVLSVSMILKEKLESLGATVLMTRTEDTEVSLQERVEYSKFSAPNLFISVHADNAADTIDLTKVEGFSVFFKNSGSNNVANFIQKKTVDNLFRKNRNTKNMNFYVIRGTWSPSVLIETGFMSHPNEFQWLTQKAKHEQLAEEWTKAIVDYFTN